MADEAVAAFNKGDYPKAVMDLKSLRSDPSTTPEQAMAIGEAMSKVQSQLAERADRGDKQAQDTLRMMQAMPHR